MHRARSSFVLFKAFAPQPLRQFRGVWVSAPGVAPGLSRPRRDVLATRRCGLQEKGDLGAPAPPGRPCAHQRKPTKTNKNRQTQRNLAKTTHARLERLWFNGHDPPPPAEGRGWPLSHQRRSALGPSARRKDASARVCLRAQSLPFSILAWLWGLSTQISTRTEPRRKKLTKYGVETPANHLAPQRRPRPRRRSPDIPRLDSRPQPPAPPPSSWRDLPPPFRHPVILPASSPTLPSPIPTENLTNAPGPADGWPAAGKLPAGRCLRDFLLESHISQSHTRRACEIVRCEISKESLTNTPGPADGWPAAGELPAGRCL